MTTFQGFRVGAARMADSTTVGSEREAGATRSARELTDLTLDLTAAVGDAYWVYMLQGELEDAFDAALFREALNKTPVLNGPSPVWAM